MRQYNRFKLVSTRDSDRQVFRVFPPQSVQSNSTDPQAPPPPPPPALVPSSITTPRIHCVSSAEDDSASGGIYYSTADSTLLIVSPPSYHWSEVLWGSYLFLFLILHFKIPQRLQFKFDNKSQATSLERNQQGIWTQESP